MKKLNLVLHAGAAHAELEQIDAVVTPAPSGDHYPISHISLIEMVQHHFAESGLNVINQVHAMTKEGLRYFGMMQIAGNNPAYDLVVGLRNTHDKSFAAGFCVGSGVFVCDNLAFSSEVTLARKHTRFIERDLPQLVARGVARLIDHRGQQEQRLLAYQNVGLDDKTAYENIVRLLKTRAILPTDALAVVKQWDEPQYAEFAQEKTVWRLFNAVTSAVRPGMNAVVNRTQALHGVCDALAMWKKADPQLSLEGIEDAVIVHDRIAA